MIELHTHRRILVRRLAETLIVVVSALGIHGPAFAGVDLPDPVSRVLAEYASRGVKIIDTFQAPGRWYGVVASAQGGGVILYIDESGENLFTGMMLDAKGRANHTETALKRYFPEQYATLGTTTPDPAPALPVNALGLTSDELARIPSVRYAAFEGEPEATLYVFMDFGCSHCKSMFGTLRSDAVSQALSDQRIALAMIPVAFSGTQTAYKSAFALAMQPTAEKFATLFGRDAPLPDDITEEQIDDGAEQLVELMSVVRAQGMSAVPWVALASDRNVVVREGAIDEAQIVDLLAGAQSSDSVMKTP
jgi:thiol:disulfide interchange protein DsbG